MALETLKGINEIGEFKVMQQRPENEDGQVNWKLFDEMRKSMPIYIDHDVNMISFRIQNGPIKETGLNGCDVQTLIETSLLMLCGLNDKIPCKENLKAIQCLQMAIYFLEERKRNREKRGVEGKNLP